MTGSAAWSILALMLAGTACRPTQGGSDAALQERAARLGQAIADSGSTDSTGALARWILPAALSEISGLALDSSGRLFAHNDESGAIFEIDYRRGVLLKQWLVGDRPLRDDFEALAVSDGRFFLLASNGGLYEFREGANDERVPFQRHDIGLDGACEFEGLAFERSGNTLVLACKRAPAEIEGLVLYRWSFEAAGSGRQPTRLVVPISVVRGANDWETFNPSDLAVDPLTGNYLLIASLQQATAEITPAGALVRSGPLPEALEMAEGVAVTRDGLLIVSTEATRSPASVSIYRRH